MAALAKKRLGSKNLALIGREYISVESSLEALPFLPGDVTIGVENEFQAAVIGDPTSVDLTLEIRSFVSSFPAKTRSRIEKFIEGNHEGVWENSWVRLKRRSLGEKLELILEHDLSSHKGRPYLGKRSDIQRFLRAVNNEEYLRIPVSYVLKLSLAHATLCDEKAPSIVASTANRMLPFLINDNLSPEVLSFSPTFLDKGDALAKKAAKETLKRFFLVQLLAMYANACFGLTESNQRIILYHSAHPPLRQRKLKSIISDAIYRELFINPCLSGWDRGEKKYEYMLLCHDVLMRSRKNTLLKLKEMGLVPNDLSPECLSPNIPLANNGTHVSIGSRKLTDLLSDPTSGFDQSDEKYLGDLVIKIVEHFLPLFVGNYSASPYRIDFYEFLPERILGFLPHELNRFHLRYIWESWERKAKIRILGRKIGPFRQMLFDRLLGIVPSLRGDIYVDYRLIDYLMAPLSTETSSALDGNEGNEERLKMELSSFGVFHPKMSLYLLYRMRDFNSRGFSGFEARYYSVFHSLMDDMGEGVALQVLLTALALKYIFLHGITHRDIPDDPDVESERRQIFFGCAVGLPAFLIRADTRNRFILKILENAKVLRKSKRYTGYLEISKKEYEKALLTMILRDARDLIELMGLERTMESLKARLDEPEAFSAYGKILRDILGSGAKDPFQFSADEFNLGLERYLRDKLRKKHMEEAYSVIFDEFLEMEKPPSLSSPLQREALHSILAGSSPSLFLEARRRDILSESLSLDDLRRLIQLVVITFHNDMVEFERRKNWVAKQGSRVR